MSHPPEEDPVRSGKCFRHIMGLEYRGSVVGRRSVKLFAKEASTCPYVLEALFVEFEVAFSQLKVVSWR